MENRGIRLAKLVEDLVGYLDVINGSDMLNGYLNELDTDEVISGGINKVLQELGIDSKLTTINNEE